MDAWFRTLPNEGETHTSNHKTEVSDSPLSYDIMVREEHVYEVDVVENIAYGAVYISHQQHTMKDSDDIVLYDTPHNQTLMSGNINPHASCGMGTNELISMNSNTAYGISCTDVDPVNNDEDYW